MAFGNFSDRKVDFGWVEERSLGRRLKAKGRRPEPAHFDQRKWLKKRLLRKYGGSVLIFRVESGSEYGADDDFEQSSESGEDGELTIEETEDPHEMCIRDRFSSNRE